MYVDKDARKVDDAICLRVTAEKEEIFNDSSIHDVLRKLQLEGSTEITARFNSCFSIIVRVPVNTSHEKLVELRQQIMTLESIWL